MTRTPRRLAALTLAAALALVGCSQDPDSDATTSTASDTTTPNAEDVAALATVTLTGERGAKPTIGLETPFTVSTAVARVVDAGDGEPLETGQSLTVESVLIDGEDGTELSSTYGAAPQYLILGDANLYPVINEALEGQHVGVRLLFAAPSDPTDLASRTNIMSLEITAATDVYDRAEGEALAPVEGLPTVTLAEDGAPSIEIPEGYTAPTELVAETLIKGAGAEVTETSTVTVNYTGWKLSDGTVFDSSWESGTPLTISLQSVVAGWTQGLAGQTVGSQVLLIIPPELGYGGQSGNELENETLVFVVDILAAV